MREQVIVWKILHIDRSVTGGLELSELRSLSSAHQQLGGATHLSITEHRTGVSRIKVN